MLVTTELTRDVLCNELVELDKCIKCGASIDMHETSQHISNMVSILMSPNDFIHVPIDAWIQDLTEIAQAIIEQKGRE